MFRKKYLSMYVIMEHSLNKLYPLKNMGFVYLLIENISICPTIVYEDGKPCNIIILE